MKVRWKGEVKSATVRISARAILLYPGFRNKKGLRVGGPPLEKIDIESDPAHLGALLMTVLDASSGEWSKDMREPKDFSKKILKAAGLRTPGSGSLVAISWDTNTRTLRFTPCRRRSGGHLGVKQDVKTVYIERGNVAIGRALVKAISKSISLG